jgi:hypothetical protein
LCSKIYAYTNPFKPSPEGIAKKQATDFYGTGEVYEGPGREWWGLRRVCIPDDGSGGWGDDEEGFDEVDEEEGEQGWGVVLWEVGKVMMVVRTTPAVPGHDELNGRGRGGGLGEW